MPLFLTILFLAGCSVSCNSRDVGNRLLASDDTVTTVMDDDYLTIAMTGDIMMGTTYPDTALPFNEGKFLFRDVKQVLQRADIAAGNLEGTLCEADSSTKKPSPHTYAFRTPPSYGRYLKEAGYDFLSMANNHAFDFGLDGVKETEHVLDSLGILYAGIAGRREWAVAEVRGRRVGFCAFGHNGYTVMHTDSAVVQRVIQALRPQVDILIVSFHGGAEGQAYSHLPEGKEEFLKEHRGYLRDFAHYCIDLGADVVYGHGPHVVRCMEVYKGHFIAYSLGNFCTPRGISLKGISGYAPIVEIKVDGSGRFIGGKIHSFVQRWGAGPRRDLQNRAAMQIRALSVADVPKSEARIDAKGNILLRKP